MMKKITKSRSIAPTYTATTSGWVGIRGIGVIGNWYPSATTTSDSVKPSAIGLRTLGGNRRL